MKLIGTRLAMKKKVCIHHHEAGRRSRSRMDLTISPDQFQPMKEVLVSEFKARCVGLLNEVHDTKKELLVTKRGRPLELVVPTRFPESGPRIAGDSSGCARIDGDLVETDQSADWECL